MPRSPYTTPLLVGGATAVGVGLVAALWPRRASASAATVPPPVAPSPRTPAPPTMRAPTPITPALPATPAGSFATHIAGMSLAAYERAVLDAVFAGHVPSSFAAYVPVTVTSRGHTGTFWCSPMPLCVGTDDAPFHAPVSAPTAQRIADHFGQFLPTRAMVDAIHAQAAVRVPFRAYGDPRQAVSTFLASSAAIEQRRAGRAGLVSDFAKDYVLTNQRHAHPDRIAIYGAWDAQGHVVQPFALPHALSYFDYSQQPRFIAPTVTVDGQSMHLVDALTSDATAHLFSSEGPLTGAMLRY